MDDIRMLSDKIEEEMPKEFISYPTYADMLFYV